jgi:hypothetical protein
VKIFLIITTLLSGSNDAIVMSQEQPSIEACFNRAVEIMRDAAPKLAPPTEVIGASCYVSLIGEPS